MNIIIIPKKKEKFANNNNTRTKLDNNDDDPFEELNMNENKNNLNIKKIDLSEDIIDLILERIAILLKGRNPNELNDDIISSNPSSERIDEKFKKIFNNDFNK